MCNPIWHPIWEAVRRDALPCRRETVIAVYSALLGEGDLAYRLKPSIVAAGLGFTRRRIEQVERLMIALAQHGVLVDGVVASEWCPNRPDASDSDARSAMRTQNRTLEPGKSDAYGVTWGNSPNASSIRSRRKYWRDKQLRAASENRTHAITSDAPLSLSLFTDQGIEKEKQTPRAREPDVTVEFAELWAIWPEHENQSDAENAYRKARRHADAETLLELGRDYLAKKPEWRGTMYLARWLRTEPWKDRRQPPLALPPQQIASSPLIHELGEPGDRLHAEVGAAIVPWLGKITVLSTSPLRLGVDSAFNRDFLLQHHEGAICRAFRVERVEIIVRQQSPAAPSNTMKQAG